MFPLASDLMGRLSDQSLRPRILPARGQVRYVPGDTRYVGSAWPALVPGWSATARLTIDGLPSSGTVFAQGTRFGGMKLSLENGVPIFSYDPTGRKLERVVLRSPDALGRGGHEVAVRFSGTAAPHRVSLLVDGEEQASAPIGRLIRIRGEAFVGRGMIDAPSAHQCDCGIRDVTIDR